MLTSGDHRQPRLDLSTGRERTRTPCPAPFNGLSNAILRKMLPSSSTSSQRVLRCAVLTIGQKLSRAGASSQEIFGHFVGNEQQRRARRARKVSHHHYHAYKGAQAEGSSTRSDQRASGQADTRTSGQGVGQRSATATSTSTPAAAALCLVPCAFCLLPPALCLLPCAFNLGGCCRCCSLSKSVRAIGMQIEINLSLRSADRSTFNEFAPVRPGGWGEQGKRTGHGPRSARNSASGQLD